MPSFKFIWVALHDFSQTNPKNTPNIWLFWQRKIFGTKFGKFCIIQKRFEQNWIKNGRAVRFYFLTLFANLNFLNFIACAIVQCFSYEHHNHHHDQDNHDEQDEKHLAMTKRELQRQRPADLVNPLFQYLISAYRLLQSLWSIIN